MITLDQNEAAMRYVGLNELKQTTALQSGENAMEQFALNCMRGQCWTTSFCQFQCTLTRKCFYKKTVAAQHDRRNMWLLELFFIVMLHPCRHIGSSLIIITAYTAAFPQSGSSSAGV